MGPPKSENIWSEPHFRSRHPGLKPQSGGPLGLSLLSAGPQFLICGHHQLNLETRSQDGDFALTGPPAPQGSLIVPTLHPHLSVRTALGWPPTSASCVSTPLAQSGLHSWWSQRCHLCPVQCSVPETRLLLPHFRKALRDI